VDGRGRAYMTGGTSSDDYPTTRGAFDRTFNGVADAFVTKLPTGVVAAITVAVGLLQRIAVILASLLRSIDLPLYSGSYLSRFGYPSTPSCVPRASGLNIIATRCNPSPNTQELGTATRA
jgi:hypothetical protein